MSSDDHADVHVKRIAEHFRILNIVIFALIVGGVVAYALIQVSQRDQDRIIQSLEQRVKKLEAKL